jgi:hypothetical protein
MSGSCLQVCDGCSRPRSGLRPGSLLPHAPARPGGGRLAGAGPPPWSRLSGMVIAFAYAGKGPTPYLVHDGSYFLPAARENNAPPACTVTARHGTGDRRDPRQGRSGPHGSRAPHGPAGTSRRDCPRPARGSPEVFRLDGRAARIRSAGCERCPHCLRARGQHRVWTPAGASWLAAPRGWCRHSDSMWHEPARGQCVRRGTAGCAEAQEQPGGCGAPGEQSSHRCPRGPYREGGQPVGGSHRDTAGLARWLHQAATTTLGRHHQGSAGAQLACWPGRAAPAACPRGSDALGWDDDGSGTQRGPLTADREPARRGVPGVD